MYVEDKNIFIALCIYFVVAGLVGSTALVILLVVLIGTSVCFVMKRGSKNRGKADLQKIYPEK